MAFKFMSLLKMYLTCLRNVHFVGLLFFTLGSFSFSLLFRDSWSLSSLAGPPADTDINGELNSQLS